MKMKVLIIDDEADQCLLIERFLSRKNYQVDYAHTLQDGMRKLNEGRHDVLLLDNNLPDGLGWGRAREIQKLFPEMQITLISANEASPYPITGDGMGFIRMEKPVSLHTLESYLKNDFIN
jgi:DNA-binding response OmpR family regulator